MGEVIVCMCIVLPEQGPEKSRENVLKQSTIMFAPSSPEVLATIFHQRPHTSYAEFLASGIMCMDSQYIIFYVMQC